MKGIRAVCCALIAAVASTIAVAGPFEQEMGFRFLAQAQRPRPDHQRDAARPDPQRDAGRSAPQRNLRGSGEPDRGRMSPDERYQLRRDIQDAGRDIYRPAQQWRGDGRRSGRR